uniref:Uncharacterized protein n=1 Tax=Rhizophora mucronata TaxID=61149 RepID=A0A2P2PNP6_RHIMU
MMIQTLLQRMTVTNQIAEI